MSGHNTSAIAKAMTSAAPNRGRRTRQLQFQVLVINREDSTDRLDFQTWQLGEMGFDFIRVDAYTPETLPPVQESYWKKWRHPLSPVQRAQLLSHGLAWDWVLENGPALIIEDDAVLARSVPEILLNLESIDGMEHLSLEVRGRRKLLSKTAIPIAHGVASHRLYLDRLGSAAYVLWPKGAEKLIKRASKGAVNVQGMALWANGLKSHQADPACAVQLDMAEKYGLSAPISSSSTTLERKQDKSVSVTQLVRLISAQTRKIWRLVRFSLVADRRKVDLRPEFFDI